MTTLVKIVIGACGAALVGAGIYYGIKDSKVKEAEINEQYTYAQDAIDQMKKDAASEIKDQVDDYLKEMDAKIEQIKRDMRTKRMTNY